MGTQSTSVPGGWCMRGSKFLSGALGALVMQGLVAACGPSEPTRRGLEGDAGENGDGDQQSDDGTGDAPEAIKTPAYGVQEASKTLQKDGGQVVTESGAVAVPKGALDGEVTVKISQVDESKVTAKQPAMLKAVSPATAFEPHKQNFKSKVALTVFYEASSDQDLIVLRIDDEKDASWERVEAKFHKGAATIATTHFSIYTVSQCDPANDPEGFCQALISGSADINGLSPELYKPFIPPMNFGDGKPEPGASTQDPRSDMNDAGVPLGSGSKDAGTSNPGQPPGAAPDAGVLPDEPEDEDPRADAGTGGHPHADAGTGSGGMDASIPTGPGSWDAGSHPDGGKDTQAPDGSWNPPWHGSDAGPSGIPDGGGATCVPKQMCHSVMRCPADIPSPDGGAASGGGLDGGGVTPSECPPEERVEVEECYSSGCGGEDPCMLDPELCGPDMPEGCEPNEWCENVLDCPPPPPSDAGASCPLVEQCDPPTPCDGGACPPPKCMQVPSCEPPPACAPEDMIEIERCHFGRICADPCLSIPPAPECAGGPNPCEPAKVEECQDIFGMCQEDPSEPECLDCHDVYQRCLK